MNIDFQKNDLQTANLTISIDKADYLEQFQDELKKQRKQAHMKGFRKGKTPLSHVRNLYGNQILAQMINEKAISGIYNYLKENEIETILDPILSGDNGQVDITHKNLQDYEFKFDVALRPEFEIHGIKAEDEYTRFNLVLSDKEAEENMDKIAGQLGNRETVKEDIEENDIITLMGDVLLTDEEGLTEPIEAEIKFLVSDLKDEIKDQLLKLKLDSEIDIDLLDIEGKDDAFVRKYYLKLEDGDERAYNKEVKASITNVERMIKSEVGEELFAKMFPGEEIKTKEEATKRLIEKTTEEHQNSSQNLLFREVMDKMMSETKIELPETFLLTWAKNAQVMKEGADEAQFLEFLKNDIKWNLIKGQLIKKFDINVTEEEVLDRAKEQVKGYFGYNMAGNDQYIDMIAQNLMNDKEQRRKLLDESMTIKMYQEIENIVTVKYEDKNMEDFYAMIDEINKQQKA